MFSTEKAKMDERALTFLICHMECHEKLHGEQSTTLLTYFPEIFPIDSLKNHLKLVSHTCALHEGGHERLGATEVAILQLLECITLLTALWHDVPELCEYAGRPGRRGHLLWRLTGGASGHAVQSSSGL